MTKVAKNKYHKLVRVRRVRIEEDEIVLYAGLFKSWKIRTMDISSLTLQRVLSLFDEIGVILVAEKNFFLREEIPGFRELSEALDFNQIFGKDWYQRTESGETLMYTRSGDEVEVVS